MLFPNKLLVIDDDKNLLESLSDLLGVDGFEVEIAYTGESGLKRFNAGGISLILTDLRLPGISGLQLLQALKAMDPRVCVILFTAYETVESAVQALKAGAYDYIVKPPLPGQIVETVKKAAEYVKLQQERHLLHKELAPFSEEKKLIGQSLPMQRIYALIRKVSETDSVVLISGESGTGKELVARAIHQNSSRAPHPFIPVDCAALPETLLESELFGYEKGAFTDATYSKPGIFEIAHGGTLFLDEVSEMSLDLQAKLLRTLQERQFRKVGGTKFVKIDARIIAATNQNLEAAVEANRFREDLYYRLNVIRISLPPLRGRKEDIPLLVAYFLEKFAAKMNAPSPEITPAALTALKSYDWPGNVRELENVIERVVVLNRGEPITPYHLPKEVQEGPSPKRNYSLKEQERQLILEALEDSNWELKKAAKLLGINRSTLYYKLEKYQLER